MLFDFGELGAALKAVKKLAVDRGVPYFVFGDPDPKRAGYVVDTKLPPSVKMWSRFWPDGKSDNERNPRR